MKPESHRTENLDRSWLENRHLRLSKMERDYQLARGCLAMCVFVVLFFFACIAVYGSM